MADIIPVTLICKALILRMVYVLINKVKTNLSGLTRFAEKLTDVLMGSANYIACCSLLHKH